MTTATSGVLARFPWLFPVRNSFASYGASAVAPCHLANGVEAVIGYECQERSNPLSLTPMIHTSHARCDKASEWVGGSFPVRNSFASYGASLAELFGESVHAGLGWGEEAQNMCTLHAGGMWWFWY